MPLITTPAIEGRTIRTCLGVVSGEAILGANILGAHILRDVFAVVPSVLGGRASAYENGLARAKETALAEMVAYGATLGADAIVGIDLDCATLGEGVSMPMVYASRTAVVIGSGPAP